jgi:hypothetical protein
MGGDHLDCGQDRLHSADVPVPLVQLESCVTFERRFATEEDCRAYWIKARWGSKPAWARCGSTYVWPIRGGTTFECRECDHHAGAVGPKHLQSYLDEFAFRHNRRKTNGVGRIAARVIEQLVARQPLTMRSLIDDTRRCRWFRSAQPA